MALPSDLTKYNQIPCAEYNKDWVNMSEHSSMLKTISNDDMEKALNGIAGQKYESALVFKILCKKDENLNYFYNGDNLGKFPINNWEKWNKTINDPSASKKDKKAAQENIDMYKSRYDKYIKGKQADLDYAAEWKPYFEHYKLDLQEAKAEYNKPVNENGNEPNIESSPTGEVKEQNKTVDVSTGTPTDPGQITSADAPLPLFYKSWDPRLTRLDAFLIKTTKNSAGLDETDYTNALRVPFATNTIASAFADLNFVVEKSFVKALVEKGKNIPLGKYFNTENANSVDNQSSDSGTTNANISPSLEGLNNSEKLIVNDTTQFEIDPANFGVQSIVNPYSLTKLMGSLDSVSHTGAENYMYDIRDKRRFYGLSTNDIISVSAPSISQLIEYGNADKWGRTPYSYQDFVYCKYLLDIKTNRLLTLRRYTAPTYDNLQFEAMYGDIESKTTGTTNPNSKENTSNKIFSPHATVVSYYGGDTGNTLSNLMNFSTGILWKDITSQINEVSGDEGSDPLAVIDQMADGKTTLFGSADAGGIIDKALTSASTVSSKIMSYGKFALALNDPVGMEEQLQMKMLNAAQDPYSSIFKNRILGPINAIKSVKAREQGISFSLNLQIKCSYIARAIGGINPKAALLDVLGNCMEMVSPTAVFWGGGFRFMVTPHAYPYHDGGWRDSFMKKIYDGKFIGDDGAIAMALSGIKKLGENKDGNGDFSWDNLTNNLGSIALSGMAMLGSAIESVSNMFGGVDFLNKASDLVNGAATSGMSEELAQLQKEAANNKMSLLFGNLLTMWHNKVLMTTTMPSIKTNGTLLIGEPVGEWHLTIGNPLNPQMVIGNLICEKMDVLWSDELGPDDFPIGFDVTYTLHHGMARDKDAILSMLNRGMGKYYCLPDWMHCSSDGMTHVDAFTEDNGTGDIGEINYKNASWTRNQMTAAGYDTHGYAKMQILGGTELTTHANPNTLLVTKFTPLNSMATRTVGEIHTAQVSGSNFAIIKSLAATRKLMS